MIDHDVQPLFIPTEHALLGDLASRGPDGQPQPVRLASDYTLTFGEMVALAGDFFESIDLMRAFAVEPRTSGRGTREEIEYARVVHARGLDERRGEFSEEAVRALNRRSYELAANNQAHFLNPLDGDPARPTLEKVTREVDSSGRLYRRYHERALKEAAAAGKGDAPVETALACEAFGAHFLTDSFSGGHLRVPRRDATEHWNRVVAMFPHNVKGCFAERIARWIKKNTTLGAVLTLDLLYEQALAGLNDALASRGIPDFTFGDVASNAIHDYDSREGVAATVGDRVVTLRGDSNLDVATKEAVIAAVRAGIEDVRRAHQDGQGGLDTKAVLDSLLQDGLYAPERLLPKVVPDADLPAERRSLPWKLADAYALLAPENGRWRAALELLLAGKRGELEAVAQGLPEGYKREAFEKAILGALEQPLELLHEVIDWTPDTGGGVLGHNADDRAMAYYSRAKKTPGGLESLTVKQKARLMRHLLDADVTVAEEEDAVFDLLTVRESDAPSLIAQIGWDRLADELGKRFTERFPK